MRGHRDLTLASAAAVLCALIAVFVPFEIVRIGVALPLTLILPGYAIVAVAFGPRELSIAKLATMSVAVSLMVLTLSSLFLNALPSG